MKQSLDRPVRGRFDLAVSVELCSIPLVIPGSTPQPELDKRSRHTWFSRRQAIPRRRSMSDPLKRAGDAFNLSRRNVLKGVAGLAAAGVTGTLLSACGNDDNK